MSSNLFVSERSRAVLDAIRATINTGGTFTAIELGAAVGLGRSAICSYLRHLESLDEIHTVIARGNALRWCKGAGQTKDAPLFEYDEDEKAADPAPPLRKIVPAQQIGMARDWAVAAIFGQCAQVSA